MNSLLTYFRIYPALTKISSKIVHGMLDKIRSYIKLPPKSIGLNYFYKYELICPTLIANKHNLLKILRNIVQQYYILVIFINECGQ